MSPNSHDPSRSPVQYPRVTIAGVSYSVKWSNSAIYRLNAAGYDIADVGRQMASGKISLKLIADIGSVCIERVPRFLPEDLADLFATPQELYEMLVPALTEAIKKALPSVAVKLQEPAAIGSPVNETPQ